MDSRACLDDVGNRKLLTLLELQLQLPGGPARSQSPYRVRYSDSYPVRHTMGIVEIQHGRFLLMYFALLSFLSMLKNFT
jgi:hypothetical protein